MYANYPKSITAAQLAETMPNAQGLLSDEPEMESSLHAAQMLLLVTLLEWMWRGRADYFVGYNLTIYFSREQLRTQDFRGPDFFVVKDVDPWLRPSWVVWEEGGKYPNIIIELLSDSTAGADRGLKKVLYQDRFRTPEYFWFSPNTLEFQGFRLSGHQYEEIPTTEQGWRWSEELGVYLGIENRQLRYFDPNGELVPTPTEAALRERIRVEQAQIQVEQVQTQLEQERIRTQRLAEKLRVLGVDPDE